MQWPTLLFRTTCHDPWGWISKKKTYEDINHRWWQQDLLLPISLEYKYGDNNNNKYEVIKTCSSPSILHLPLVSSQRPSLLYTTTCDRVSSEGKTIHGVWWRSSSPTKRWWCPSLRFSFNDLVVLLHAELTHGDKVEPDHYWRGLRVPFGVLTRMRNNW